jgi:radical SAM protein with 4Fe4S-binding SPASM domain
MVSLEIIGKKLIEKMPRRIKSIALYNFHFIYFTFTKFMLYGFKDMPLTVGIEINSICNRQCYYCPRKANKNIALTKEIFYSIIDELKGMGFKGRITPNLYNEPLTDKRLFAFLDYVNKNLNCKIMIYTNGDLLDEDKVKKLISIGVSEFRVSIHEPTPDNRVEQLKELKKKYNKIVLIDFRDKYRKVVLDNRGGRIKLKNVLKFKKCIYPGSLIIRANGDVCLCCNDTDGEYVFGNVYKEKLSEIWNKEEYKKLRENIRKGIFELPICKKCGYELNINKKFE